MTTKDYLEILRNEIHSTVVATVDGEGRPVTRVIDIGNCYCECPADAVVKLGG